MLHSILGCIFEPHKPSVVIYFILAGLIIIVTFSALAHLFNWSFGRLSNRSFFLLIALLLLINKTPNILNNSSLNSDEAINLAVVQSLHLSDPVLWRSADFSTLGPFHSLAFGIPLYFGLDLNYTHARLVLFIISVLSYFFIFKACQLVYGKKYVQISVLYPFLFFLFGNLSSLNHFYNEATSILILAIGIYLYILRRKSVSSATVRYEVQDFLFFLLMGLTPYFKLQAVPIALFLCVSYYLLGFKKTFRNNVGILLSGLFPTLILLIYLAIYKQFDNFYRFYILTNFGYGDTANTLTKLFNTFLVRSLNELPISYLLKTPFLLTTILLTVLLPVSKKDRFGFFVLGLSWITIYAISKPGYSYSHYFTFILIPLPLLIGHTIKNTNHILLKVSTCSTVILLSAILSFYNLRDSFQTGLFKDFVPKIVNYRNNTLYLSEVGKEINLLKERFPQMSKLVSFDWYPEIHLETGLIQGTHINVPERLFGYQVSDSTSTAFARKIYLEDLYKNKPEIVLIPTSTKRSYFDFTYAAFDQIPEIKSYVDDHYSFYKNVDDVDIYILNDIVPPE